VHPGPTITEREPPAAAVEAVSIGRAVTAAEVADVIAFLASPRSVAINGDAIAAGGGTRGAIHYFAGREPSRGAWATNTAMSAWCRT
jgi:NAD(P)-dependent dehydrogenase (short-subunit alcohol dehydrogenase family)